MPSVRATIVGPSPAEPTIPFRTRSAPEAATSSRIPSVAGQHAALPGPPGLQRRGLGIGEGDGGHPVIARLLDQALPVGAGGEPDDGELIRAGDDLQRLLADRAGGAEDDELLHPDAV